MLDRTSGDISFDRLSPTAANGAASDDPEWRQIDAQTEPPHAFKFRHPKHGAASASWVYRKATGQPVCVVARFDFERDGKLEKAVMPYTFGERRGQPGWHPKMPTEPRLLFGLDRLTRGPDAPVIVVEGEKSADAAAAIFRNMAAVTSIGGSGAAGKADWSPLAGRRVVVWPDNDEPGRAYAADVERCLRQVGVASVRIVDVPASWPEKWDVAEPMPEGVTTADLRQMAAPAKPSGPYLLTPSQCAIEPIRPYVVKGLLSRGDHGALIGLPGSGKSVAAPYIGYRAALGLDVFGYRTKPIVVLYIAAEDGGGMKQRVRALLERMGDAPNFLLQPVPVDFLNSQSGDVAAIERLIAKHQPGLVIVDTVARAFPGLKENDPDEMGRVVKVARGLTMICDSAVLSLHHPPKDSVTPRGHSVLNGDLDVTLYLEGSGSGPRQVTMGKNRNGPSDTTFGFALGVHTLDGLQDADGDPVTAPVAEPMDGAATPRNAAKEARLRDQPAILLRELRALIDQQGTMVQPSLEFPVVRAVTRAVLRQRLIERAWFSDDLLSTVESSKPKLDRKAYGVEANAFKPLKRQGFVGFTQDWVWLL